MSANNTKIWTVSELNLIVKEFIEANFPYNIWVEGEISGLTNHNSGHVYFTLKDKNSQIRVTFFNGREQSLKLGLKQGSMIEALGKLSVYHPRGEYQFNAIKIRLKGVGDLHRKFEELKEKLQKEGLFDKERKKRIPLLPLKIGIVTSPDGAAIKDFIKVITNRFPRLHIRIYPAAVQGAGAELQIAEGIRFFNESSFPDVIIITRGGGSIEDLWAFNEESLARAIAESKIPVISAVGHEIDFTISDFVADLRAPTPTAAAEIVISKEEDFLIKIKELKHHAEMFLRLKVEKSRSKLQELKANKIFSDPHSIIREKQEKLDEINKRLFDSMKNFIENKGQTISLLTAKIAMLSPYKVLERGYAILQKTDLSVVDDSSKTTTGEELTAILARGTLKLKVEETKN